jgi:serine/threonine-protein kinase
MDDLDGLVRRMAGSNQPLDSLVAAVELHRLSAQLRGISLTDAECIAAVLAVRDSLAARSAPTLPAMREPAGPTDYTASPDPVIDADPQPLAPGRVLGGEFVLGARLGAGGMAEVFRAEAVHGGTPVAVKVMHADAGNDLADFFEQEARALMRLDHPAILKLHRVGMHGRRVFLVTEFVEGATLRERIRFRLGFDGPAAHAWALYRDIVAAVAHAHAAGVIHRDLKPENVLCARGADGREHAKVMDFGLAIVDELCPRGEVTAQGQAAGTLAYMAPEQAQGARLTPAADVYALALIGYEMVSGINPFRGATPMETMRRQLEVEVPPLAEAAGPITSEEWPGLGVLDAVLRRALSRDPAQRPRDAGELGAQLEALDPCSR